MQIIPKGWRTIAFNVLTALITVAGTVLQYLDMLGLDPVSFALVAIGLNVFTQIGNMILRTITTTPIGHSK